MGLRQELSWPNLYWQELERDIFIELMLSVKFWIGFKGPEGELVVTEALHNMSDLKKLLQSAENTYWYSNNPDEKEWFQVKYLNKYKCNAKHEAEWGI